MFTRFHGAETKTQRSRAHTTIERNVLSEDALRYLLTVATDRAHRVVIPSWAQLKLPRLPGS